MHRLRHALALVPTLILPSVAAAQSGSNNMSGASNAEIIITYGEGENAEQQMNVTSSLRIGGPDCEDDIKVTFEVDPARMNSQLQDKILELWTSNTGTMCSDEANRRSDNGCSGTTCDLITSAATMTDDFTVSTTALELFGGGDGECPASGVVRVALVFVNNPAGDCTAAAQDTAQGKYYADFELRTANAPTPTDVKARDGDSSFSVSWSQGSGGRSTDQYQVLAVPGDQLDGGGSCPPVFTGTEPPTTEELEDIDGLIIEDGAKSISTRALGLEYGERASIAVISRDLFGNRSQVSNSSCATRIPTSGLVDAYESETGKTVKTCSSSGVPSGDGGTAWIGLGVLLLGALGVRRARSAS